MNALPNRRIDSAHRALERCKESGSEWGITYWTIVINALVRKLNRESVN